MALSIGQFYGQNVCPYYLPEGPLVLPSMAIINGHEYGHFVAIIIASFMAIVIAKYGQLVSGILSFAILAIYHCH